MRIGTLLHHFKEGQNYARGLDYEVIILHEKYPKDRGFNASLIILWLFKKSWSELMIIFKEKDSGKISIKLIKYALYKFGEISGYAERFVSEKKYPQSHIDVANILSKFETIPRNHDPIATQSIFKTNSWKAYYINLDHRTDRKENVEKEFLKNNITAERFSALEDKDIVNFPDLKLSNVCRFPRNHGTRIRTVGEWGCTLSHYSVLKKSLDKQNMDSLSPIVIFEDDVRFCDDFKERLDYLGKNFKFDWDIFYFSVSADMKYCHKTDVKYIYKIDSTVCAHAYMINPKSIAKLIELTEYFAKKTCIIDEIYDFLIPHLNVYSFLPGMVAQNGITGNIGDRKNVTEYFIKRFGKHVFESNLFQKN